VGEGLPRPLPPPGADGAETPSGRDALHSGPPANRGGGVGRVHKGHREVQVTLKGQQKGGGVKQEPEREHSEVHSGCFPGGQKVEAQRGGGSLKVSWKEERSVGAVGCAEEEEQREEE